MGEGVLVIGAVVAAVLLVLLFRAFIGLITIFEYQRGLKYVGGRLAGLIGPGQHWIFRPSTHVDYIDIRETLMVIQGQEVVSSDTVSVKVSVVARYKVADPVVAYTRVESYYQATYTLLQIAMRETVGALTIDDVLQKREEIGAEILRRCVDQAKALGVELIAVDVRDLMFPGALKKTFAQVLEARQQGLAALEKARGETAALRSLANAARMVEANPSLLQLRLIQQLEATRGHTIVLGMPASSTPLPLRSEPVLETPELASGKRAGPVEAE